MKKFDLKNQKVLVGLLSLLFITSFVNTQAILKISPKSAPDTQPAQVFSASNCLQITPAYNTLEGYKYTPFPEGNNHVFSMYMNIRNNCTSAIHIVNPVSMETYNKLNQATSLIGVGLQVFNSENPITPIDVTPGSGYPINVYQEFAYCSDCIGGGTLYYTSPVGTQGSINAFTLNAGQRKTFMMSLVTATPIDNLSLYRVIPKNIKWFYHAALADSVVAATEIKTTVFTAEQQASLATDYLRVNLLP